MPFDALEYVVRPYTTPNAHGSIIIPSTPRGSHEKATLTWGGGAFELPERKEVSDGVSFEVICCQEALSEDTREVDEVTVTDPTGGESYVIVQRPKTLQLKKKGTNTCADDEWGQTHAAPQAINPALDEYGDTITSGVVTTGDTCAVKWNFNNQQQ
jgi:hypothetical protein